MNRTKEEIEKCIRELKVLISNYRKNSERKTRLIPIEEEYRRAKAYCTHYYIRESAESIGLNSGTLRSWMKRRGIRYI